MEEENRNALAYEDVLNFYKQLKVAMDEQGAPQEIMSMIDGRVTNVTMMRDQDPLLEQCVAELKSEAQEDGISAEERSTRFLMMGWLSELRDRRLDEETRAVRLSQQGCGCEGSGGCEGCQ